MIRHLPDLRSKFIGWVQLLVANWDCWLSSAWLKMSHPVLILAMPFGNNTISGGRRHWSPPSSGLPCPIDHRVIAIFCYVIIKWCPTFFDHFWTSSLNYRFLTLNWIIYALVYQRTSGPLGPVLKKIWRTGPFRTSKLPKGPLRTAFFDPGTIIRFFKMHFLEF